MVTLTTGLLWLLATVATYRICRTKDENPALADAVGSFIFWPLLLPLFIAATVFRVSDHYAKRFIQWNTNRRNPPALRAGSDNGLYE